MKVNLPVRWREVSKLSDDEKLERRALDMDDEPVELTEGFLTIDTDNIEDWNASDENHTTIRTITDKAYSVAMGHSDFDKLWTQLTGEAILEIRIKPIKAKISKKSESILK